MEEPTQSQSQNSLPSISNLFGWTFSFYRAHLPLILGISAVPLLVAAAQLYTKESSSAFGAIELISFVANFISYLALYYTVVHEGRNVGDVYKKSLGLLFPFIWVNILVTLTTLGGIFLLLIPGVILSIWLNFSIFVVFSEGHRGISALTTSWHYAKGYWKSIFWRLLVFTLILGGAFLITGLILNSQAVLTAITSKGTTTSESPLYYQLLTLLYTYLLLNPLYIIYTYGIYRSLKQFKKEPPAQVDEKRRRKAIIIFSIIGAVVVVGMIAIFSLALLSLNQGYSTIDQVSPIDTLEQQP